MFPSFFPIRNPMSGQSKFISVPTYTGLNYFIGPIGHSKLTNVSICIGTLEIIKTCFGSNDRTSKAVLVLEFDSVN